MPREFPNAISCPSCGEPMPRHCPTNQNCGWFICLAEGKMLELGRRNPLSQKWAIRKSRRWIHLR